MPTLYEEEEEDYAPLYGYRHMQGSIFTWGKIRQVYPPKNFLSPISLKVREIIILVNLF